MRLTKLTDYGVVLLTHVARATHRTVHTARDLAHEARLPLPTVGRLLKLLATAGLLTSHRGVHGGYSLARPATEISVAQIIAVLEGPISLTECSDQPSPGTCQFEPHCPTRTNWHKINTAVRDALDSITLADMTQPLACDKWLPPARRDPAAREPVRSPA
jgi:FeS assembly SUF system regulator